MQKTFSCICFTIPVLLLAILFFTCGSNSTQKVTSEDSQRKPCFATDLDTFYKINSTKIERITRAFFWSEAENMVPRGEYDFAQRDFHEISKEKGKNVYTYMIYNAEADAEPSKFTSTYLTEKQLIQMFNNIDTIFSNPNKGLTYNIGKPLYSNSYNYRITAMFSTYDGKCSIQAMDSNLEGKDKYATMVLSRKTLDSMKYCFSRFKAEGDF